MNGDSMIEENQPYRRRQFLGAVASTGSVVLAGCLEENGDDDEDDVEFVEEIEEDRQLNGVVLDSTFPLQLFEPNTDNRVAEVHFHAEFSEWHFQPFEIPLDGFRAVDVRFFDSDVDVIPVGSDERFQLDIRRSAETDDELLEFEITFGPQVNFHGTAEGEGELLWYLLEDGESVWTSPPLDIAVVDDLQD